jgi:hypothetical protein
VNAPLTATAWMIVPRVIPKFASRRLFHSFALVTDRPNHLITSKLCPNLLIFRVGLDERIVCS